MKLKNGEMALIVLLMVFAIIGAGFYFFVYPNLTAIESLEVEISDTYTLIQKAYDAIAEEELVNQQYEEAKLLPQLVQGAFYPEMTVTEAEKIFADIIAANGHEPTNGINVSPMQAVSLKVTVPEAAKDIDYELRKYAFLKDATEETAETEAAEASSENTDADTAETAPTDEGESNEEGEGEITLKNAMEFLRTEKDTAKRRDVARIVRNMLAEESAEIAMINGHFSIDMTAGEYLQFLDYLNNLPQATSIDNAVFKGVGIVPGNTGANANTEENVENAENAENTDNSEENTQGDAVNYVSDDEVYSYNFSLKLYIIREMDFID